MISTNYLKLVDSCTD